MMKKLLAMVLALAVMLSLATVTVFADENGADTGEDQTDTFVISDADPNENEIREDVIFDEDNPAVDNDGGLTPEEVEQLVADLIASGYQPTQGADGSDNPSTGLAFSLLPTLAGIALASAMKKR